VSLANANNCGAIRPSQNRAAKAHSHFCAISRGQIVAFGKKWAWSLIRNEKPIGLFERNYYATEKSEASGDAGHPG
jgi:hypothetical protein